MEKDFKEFIALLISNNVDFMLVGGYAVAIYGYPRFTEGMDLLIRCDQENAERLLQALRDFGFCSLGLTVEVFLHPERVIQLGMPPVRIDLLTSISGISDYKQLFQNGIKKQLDGLLINVIAFDDLITNKQASGRDKDLIDVKKLRAIQKK